MRSFLIIASMLFSMSAQAATDSESGHDGPCYDSNGHLLHE